MKHGPAFDFDKPQKLDIHTLPLEEAKRRLDEHMARRVAYDPKLPPTHAHNEAASRWARDKHPLAYAFEQAQAFSGAITKKVKGTQPNPGHFQGFPVQHFVDRVNEFLRKMNALPEADPEWYHLRNQACSARHAAMRRARETKDRTTIIPEIPRKRRVTKRPMPSPTLGVKRNAYYKPLAHFVAKLQGLLDEMAGLNPWTNEWEALRDRACAARSAAQRRAFETGDTTTPIPEVPRRGARVIPR